MRGANRRGRRRTTIASLLSLTAIYLVAGCSTNSRATDDSDITLNSAEAGSRADGHATREAGSKSEPLRTVTTTEMPLGETPASNRVLDPSFDLLGDADYWQVTDPTGTTLMKARRRVETASPTRAPMLEVPARDGDQAVRIFGLVLLDQNPVEVSVWLAVDSRQDLESLSPTVRIYGLAPDSSAAISFSTLEQSASEPPRESHGKRWYRYEGIVEGYLGYGYMTISVQGGDAIYLHAPVATALTPPANAPVDLDAARTSRQPAGAEAVGWFRAFEKRRRRDRPRALPMRVNFLGRIRTLSRP